MSDFQVEELESSEKNLVQNTDKKKQFDPENMTKEERRLGAHRALKTDFKLSIGPLLSQITGALYGIVTTIWVSRAVPDGMAAISTYNCFDGIGRAFGYFIGTAGSSKISSLIGLHKTEETGQVIADLLRICIVCGIVVPCILIPCLKPAGRWFGASERVVSLGFDYMLPLCICTFSTCFFLGVGGCLQGEGRSLFFGVVNLIAVVCNMLILNPLFLFGIKTGIVGAGLATIIAEMIPGFTLVFMYFSGHFNVKPKWNMLLKKFSPHTLPALRVGISQLIANLSVLLPSILVRKLLGDRVKEDYNDVMSAFNAGFRILALSNAVMVGFTMGYLPAASYAYSAGRYKRFMRLTMHTFWMNLSWAAVLSILTWSIPRYLAMIFSTEEGYLRFSSIITICNGFAIFQVFRYNAQTFLQALQKGTQATVLSFINNFVTIVIFAFIFYYVPTDDQTRVLWAYPASYVTAFVISFIWIARSFYIIYKKSKESEGINDNEEDEEEDGDPELKEISNSTSSSSQNQIDTEKDTELKNIKEF
ncbi:MatE family protein [Histomonas meleagridis]|uniref:MatE family protein n=1 Tax=Histomonas meleagridis TaxID=135588 RepID=UPI003559A539|nr:MatE family protein [Histomonas meleagridis]KAH0797042.1 MatE family protein [Histomonas meleagridis]